MRKIVKGFIGILIIAGISFCAWTGLGADVHKDCMRAMLEVEGGRWWLTENFLVAVPLDKFDAIFKDSSWRSALQKLEGKDTQFAYFRLHKKCESPLGVIYRPITEWKGDRLPVPSFIAMPDLAFPRMSAQIPQMLFIVVGLICAYMLYLVVRSRFTTTRSR